MTVAPTPEEAQGQHVPTLRDIVREHGAFVCRSLRILGVSDADLDDMVQEVLVVLHHLLRDYEERGRTRSWLYSVCKRVVRAERRKLMRWSRDSSAELHEVPAEATQFEHIKNAQALALGRKMLGRLTPEQREIFWLYEVEELSVPAIAKTLGWPLQTAYSRLSKARELIVAEVRRASARDRS